MFLIIEGKAGLGKFLIARQAKKGAVFRNRPLSDMELELHAIEISLQFSFDYPNILFFHGYIPVIRSDIYPMCNILRRLPLRFI